MEGGSKLVILLPLIGCEHSQTPPTLLCHESHHFCCKTRDCCCCCSLSPWISVFIESLLEMRWSMCRASAATGVSRSVTKEKRMVIIWPHKDKTQPEDRLVGAEEDKLTGRYKRMGAWEDRSWYVCWRFGVTEGKTERQTDQRTQRQHRLKEDCKSKLPQIAETEELTDGPKDNKVTMFSF